ncbi:hypothetical protein LZZ90_06325 [Flavobacterium sp. SM15]|uniref:MbnP family protein n=1 Tax=Flavobacterium sp. SM15 TaxID=2908005 RepID=UPI001ED9E3FB|nr:MbnP family protein [Flavobacterium sp. SM15]MCG2611117.1 hypothetical protein [Flavobacterium sp. SM15]
MQFKNLIAFMAVLITLVACNNDETILNSNEKGKLEVEFDNIFSGADLTLNNQLNTTSQGENLKIGKIKYIVSNIVLTKEDGTVFVYPKNQSYFIVDESDETKRVLELQDVPVGNYTQIKFGIGVDQAQYNLGATGQGDFLAQAEAADMLGSWDAGYKFIAFEGTFTSNTVSSDTPFMVHTGKTASNYNYTEITLSMPDKALVRTKITPEIHIMADVNKIIDGANKIKLSDNTAGGMGAMIMSGNNVSLITANLQEMFSVNHVHND